VKGAAMMLSRKLAWMLLAVPLAVAASESVKLDRLPADVDPHDPVSLQRGVQVYVNHCLGCHSLAYMRYNRLQDLGLTEQQIKDNLIFSGAKVGELMKIAMDPRESREWFGTPPPDLTVIARSRASGAGSGADWLYSYLRGFYRDPSRPNGWNNTVFQNVEKPGSMKPAEYDRMVGDLVNFLVYVGEPSRHSRVELGIYVLLFLGVLFVFAYLLKKEFWKDVH
jgi:ubiquinol-cytochrome c reductase cytochrome c1 subunit